jgi:hypothetical protein
MRPHKYALIADDDTLLVSCDEMEPLISEAKAIVKSGDYGHTQLGIFTLTHEFVLPAKPELKVRRVK